MQMFRPLLTISCFALTLAACSKKAPDPVADIPAPMVKKALREFTANWDLDDDGQATCADINLLRTQQFSRLDANGDGGLSSVEYRAINFEDNSFVFHEHQNLDIDQSGALDLSEFSTVSHSLFRGTDKDGDCVIGLRDAAFIVLKNRKNGIGPGRPRDNPRKRRKGGSVDPF